MSRIGSRILKIPDSIKISILENVISVSSDQNKIDIPYDKFLVNVSCENKELKTTRGNSSRNSKALCGTINSLVNNAVIGLTTGFVKQLEIVGVGYKAFLEGTKLKLVLGFSHPIFLDIPKEVKVELISSIEIKLSSFHKEILGEFAALIRKFRAPEPYKGKGIKNKGEVIIRKIGKTSEGNKK